MKYDPGQTGGGQTLVGEFYLHMRDYVVITAASGRPRMHATRGAYGTGEWE